MNTEDTSELFRIKKQVENDKSLPAKQNDTALQRTPDDDALKQIRALLNPGGRSLVSKREAFIPQELNELMEKLVPHIEQAGVAVAAIENISYGKKLKMKMGLKEAEINVFYGKKGYSVIISPRRGTNDELNALMAQLIEQYLYQGELIIDN